MAKFFTITAIAALALAGTTSADVVEDENPDLGGFDLTAVQPADAACETETADACPMVRCGQPEPGCSLTDTPALAFDAATQACCPKNPCETICTTASNETAVEEIATKPQETETVAEAVTEPPMEEIDTKPQETETVAEAVTEPPMEEIDTKPQETETVAEAVTEPPVEETLAVEEEVPKKPAAEETAAPAFDCSTKEVWTAEKQVWCCAERQLGCTATEQGDIADDESSGADAPAKVTDAPEADATKPPAVIPAEAGEYNCRTKEVWSSEKAKWCCKNFQLGCPIVVDQFGHTIAVDGDAIDKSAVDESAVDESAVDGGIEADEDASSGAAVFTSIFIIIIVIALIAGYVVHMKSGRLTRLQYIKQGLMLNPDHVYRNDDEVVVERDSSGNYASGHEQSVV